MLKERRRRKEFWTLCETTKQRAELIAEKERQDNLLLDILPKEFISRLLTLPSHDGGIFLEVKWAAEINSIW